jgi:hypothetical protein
MSSDLRALFIYSALSSSPPSPCIRTKRQRHGQIIIAWARNEMKGE